jgi:hypothetical protein
VQEMVTLTSYYNSSILKHSCFNFAFTTELQWQS